tara:strand:+ start:466 stop:942 length:477 start_codon:yes stop_codon:yes gene_type:complete
MAYSKPNPIKQLQSQDQYKQDFEADLMEAGGETPLMQAKSKKDIRRKNRADKMTDSEKESMKERIKDGSNEFEGGSDVGNFLRKNSYNHRKNSTGQGSGGLASYLKKAQADQDQKEQRDFEDFGNLGKGGGGNKYGNGNPGNGQNKQNQDVDGEDKGV